VDQEIPTALTAHSIMAGRVEAARMLADYSLMSEEELIEYIANTIDVRTRGPNAQVWSCQIPPRSYIVLTPNILRLHVQVLWTLIGACLVFFMQIGFSMLEVGSVHASSTKNVLVRRILPNLYAC
jgi:hypothetical protein